MDVYEESDPARLSWAAATCALVLASDLQSSGGDAYTLRTYAYRIAGLPPCDGERFANQPTAAFCTGFMVKGDLIATAGHCLHPTDLPYVRFVFGFDMKNATTPNLSFTADQIYTGVEIVARRYSWDYDYAIVRVDREIVAPGASALPLRTEGAIAVGEQVGVIGHPAGLPKKIAFGDNTVVRENNNPAYLVANLDTYGGNSGSPVFNAATRIMCLNPPASDQMYCPTTAAGARTYPKAPHSLPLFTMSIIRRRPTTIATKPSQFEKTLSRRAARLALPGRPARRPAGMTTAQASGTYGYHRAAARRA